MVCIKFMCLHIPISLTFTSSKNFFMSGQVVDEFFCVTSSYFYFCSCFVILSIQVHMYYVFTFCHSSASTLRSTAIKPSFCKNSIIRDGSNLKKLGKSKHLQCFHWGNICSFWYLPIGTYQKQTMSLQMNSLERNYTGCKTFTICQTD